MNLRREAPTIAPSGGDASRTPSDIEALRAAVPLSPKR